MKSLLRNAHKSNENNNKSDGISIQSDRLHIGYRQNQADINRPLSVMVDVVNHDEPSVCSVVSNGPTNNGLTQTDGKVSRSILNMTLHPLILRENQPSPMLKYHQIRNIMAVFSVLWVSG